MHVCSSRADYDVLRAFSFLDDNDSGLATASEFRQVLPCVVVVVVVVVVVAVVVGGGGGGGGGSGGDSVWWWRW